MAEAAVKEPSMEDILASIRKIISQEDGKGRPEPAGASVYPPTPKLDTPRLDAPRLDTMASLQASVSATRPAPYAPAPYVAVPVAPAAVAPVAAPRPLAQPVVQTGASPAIAPAGGQGMPRAQSASTLAALASQVKSQMPHPVAPAIASPAAIAPAPYQPALMRPAAIAPAAPRPDNEIAAFRDALVSPSTARNVGQSVDRLKAAVADNQAAKVEAVLRPMLREWLDQNLSAMVERIVREEIERIARS